MENSSVQSAGLKRDVSPIDAALNINLEYISSIESKIEELSVRLLPVLQQSTGSEVAEKNEINAVLGNSKLVESIASQGNRLIRILNNLSYITKDLEI